MNEDLYHAGREGIKEVIRKEYEACLREDFFSDIALEQEEMIREYLEK